METLGGTLYERVNELLEAHKHQSLLSTTGPHTAVPELVARFEGLELAVQEIALELEKLVAQHGPAA